MGFKIIRKNPSGGTAPDYSDAVDGLLAVSDTPEMRDYLAPVLRGTTQAVTATSGTVAITSGVNRVIFENTLAGTITLTVPNSDDYAVGDSIEVSDLLGKMTSSSGVQFERGSSGDQFLTFNGLSNGPSVPVMKTAGGSFRFVKVADGVWKPDAFGGSATLQAVDTGAWIMTSNAGQIWLGFLGRAIFTTGDIYSDTTLTSGNRVLARSNGPTSFEGLCVSDNPPAGGQLFLRRDVIDRWLASAGDGSPIDFRARGYKYTPIAISALPAAASSEGLRYEVNDANSPSVGATVASGGSGKCEVRSNGANWIVTQVF